jgi:hypothetical protein
VRDAAIDEPRRAGAKGAKPFDGLLSGLYRCDMHKTHARSRFRAASLVGCAALSLLVCGLHGARPVYGADPATPAAGQAVGDRYVVAVSGMT